VTTDTILVRFNRPPGASTVTPETFRVEGQGGHPVGGYFFTGTARDGSADPRVLVFQPDAPLAPASAFEVRLTTGIQGPEGTPLAESLLFGFATSATKSTSEFSFPARGDRPRRVPSRGPAPRVTWTFPQTGLGSVYTDAVRVRFDRKVALDSLVEGGFSLVQGAVDLPGTLVSADGGAGYEMEFRPERPLFRDVTYQMVVTRECRSVRGRFLRKEFRGGFSTSPFKDGVKPLRPEDFATAPASLVPGRAFHTATILVTGDVLFAGGQDLSGSPLASCTVYRPASGNFETVAPMETPRRKHAAALLRDGTVLVSGGFGPLGNTLASSEVFHPDSGTWTPGPTMGAGRANHTLTPVGSTRVLAAGGFSSDAGPLDYAAGAEVHDFFQASWSPTKGSPVAVRGGHSATLLSDGRVFLAGGTRLGVQRDEFYLPATDGFVEAGIPPEERRFHAACLTRAGTVLLAGGGPARASQFVPATGAYLEAGSCPPFGLPESSGPLHASLSPLPGGRIALVGGLVPGGGGGGFDLVLDQVQLWDPGSLGGNPVFYPMLFTLDRPRAGHTVSLLPDGSFLIAGGLGTSGSSNETVVTIFRPGN
jgi:hypothetical protein